MPNEAIDSSTPNPWSIWTSCLKQISSGGGMFSLNEPILPNGTFAGIVINENNSSDPSAEKNIISQQSYGRQLGQLLDAVAEAEPANIKFDCVK